MTPEERAVVEAALAFDSESQWTLRWSDRISDLMRAVDALRKSREPKPRYVVEDLGDVFRVSDTSPSAPSNACILGWSYLRRYADRIADALNAQEAKK